MVLITRNSSRKPHYCTLLLNLKEQKIFPEHKMCHILVIKLNGHDIIYFEIIRIFFGNGLQHPCKNDEGKIKFSYFDHMNIDFYEYY